MKHNEADAVQSGCETCRPDPFTRGPDDPRVSYRNNWYAAIHGEATLYGEWLNPHSFNRYLYCNNNPVNGVDPLGLEVLWKQLGSASFDFAVNAIGTTIGAIGFLAPEPATTIAGGILAAKCGTSSALAFRKMIDSAMGNEANYSSDIIVATTQVVAPNNKNAQLAAEAASLTIDVIAGRAVTSGVAKAVASPPTIGGLPTNSVIKSKINPLTFGKTEKTFEHLSAGKTLSDSYNKAVKSIKKEVK